MPFLGQVDLCVKLLLLSLIATACRLSPAGSYWPGDLRGGGLQEAGVVDGQPGEVEHKGAGQHYTTEPVPGGVKENRLCRLMKYNSSQVYIVFNCQLGIRGRVLAKTQGTPLHTVYAVYS